MQIKTAEEIAIDSYFQNLTKLAEEEGYINQQMSQPSPQQKMAFRKQAGIIGSTVAGGLLGGAGGAITGALSSPNDRLNGAFEGGQRGLIAGGLAGGGGNLMMRGAVPANSIGLLATGAGLRVTTPLIGGLAGAYHKKEEQQKMAQKKSLNKTALATELLDLTSSALDLAHNPASQSAAQKWLGRGAVGTLGIGTGAKLYDHFKNKQKMAAESDFKSEGGTLGAGIGAGLGVGAGGFAHLSAERKFENTKDRFFKNNFKRMSPSSVKRFNDLETKFLNNATRSGKKLTAFEIAAPIALGGVGYLAGKQIWPEKTAEESNTIDKLKSFGGGILASSIPGLGTMAAERMGKLKTNQQVADNAANTMNRMGVKRKLMVDPSQGSSRIADLATEVPTFNPSFPTADAALLTNNRVPQSVISHEVGHLKNYDNLTKLLGNKAKAIQFASRARGIGGIGSLAGSIHSAAEDDPSYTGSIMSGVANLPTLLDEGGASYHAMKDLKRVGGIKSMAKGAIPLGLGFSSYLAGAATPLAINKFRKYYNEQKQQKTAATTDALYKGMKSLSNTIKAPSTHVVGGLAPVGGGLTTQPLSKINKLTKGMYGPLNESMGLGEVVKNTFGNTPQNIQGKILLPRGGSYNSMKEMGIPLPQISGQGQKAFNTATILHEGFEKGVNPSTAGNYGLGHMSPKVLFNEHNMMTNMTGPGAEEAKGAFQKLRSLTGEDQIMKQTLQDAYGPRMANFSYGEGTKIPKAMKKDLINKHRQKMQSDLIKMRDSGMFDEFKQQASIKEAGITPLVSGLTHAGLGGVVGGIAGASANPDSRLSGAMSGAATGMLAGGISGSIANRFSNNAVGSLAKGYTNAHPLSQEIRNGAGTVASLMPVGISAMMAKETGQHFGAPKPQMQQYYDLYQQQKMAFNIDGLEQLAHGAIENIDLSKPKGKLMAGGLMAGTVGLGSYGAYRNVKNKMNRQKMAFSWQGFKDGIEEEGIPLSGAVLGAGLGWRNPLRGAALGYLGGSAASVGKALATGEEVTPARALLAASGAGYGLGALGHMGLQKFVPNAAIAGRKLFQGHGPIQSGLEELLPATGATLGAGLASGLTHNQTKQPQKLAFCTINDYPDDGSRITRLAKEQDKQRCYSIAKK